MVNSFPVFSSAFGEIKKDQGISGSFPLNILYQNDILVYVDFSIFKTF